MIVDRKGLLSRSPKRRLAAAGLLLAAVVAGAWLLWPKRETLEQGLNTTFACLERMDAPCLVRYLSEEEAAFGVDEAKIQQLLDQVHKPIYEGLKVRSEPTIRIDSTGQTGTKGVLLYDDTGRWASKSVTMAMSEDGPRLFSFVTSTLSLAGLATIRPGPDGMPIGDDKAKGLAAGLSPFVPQLEAMGFREIPWHDGWGPVQRVRLRDWLNAYSEGRKIRPAEVISD